MKDRRSRSILTNVKLREAAFEKAASQEIHFEFSDMILNKVRFLDWYKPVSETQVLHIHIIIRL